MTSELSEKELREIREAVNEQFYIDCHKAWQSNNSATLPQDYLDYMFLDAVKQIVEDRENAKRDIEELINL